jgi:hypothetical protein
MTFEHLNTIFHHVRGKHKQPFTFWYCVDNFYPWKDIVGKKVLKLRSIAVLRYSNKEIEKTPLLLVVTYEGTMFNFFHVLKIRVIFCFIFTQYKYLWNFLYVAGKKLRIRDENNMMVDVKQGAEERSSLGRKLLFSRYSGNQKVRRTEHLGRVYIIAVLHTFNWICCEIPSQVPLSAAD